jgi:DNA-binding transcriptional LysR family regulator
MDSVEEFQDKSWFDGLRLKMRHLQLVQALAEYRNLTLGAASLGLTQPAASKLLFEIERETGVPLFRRLPRGLTLTDAGQALVHRIRAVSAELREAGAEISAIKQGRSGNVTFGCTEGATIAHVLPAIALVQREHPKLRLQIHVETSDVLATLIQQRRLEFVLGRIPSNVDPALFLYRQKTHGRISFICRAGHSLVRHRCLQPSDLVGHDWILPPVHTPIRQWLNVFFMSRDLPAPERVIVNYSASTELTVGVVACTDSLAILSETTANLFCASAGCTILPLEGNLTTTPFGIFWLRERPLSPSAATVVAALETAHIRRCNPGA